MQNMHVHFLKFACGMDLVACAAGDVELFMGYSSRNAFKGDLDNKILTCTLITNDMSFYSYVNAKKHPLFCFFFFFCLNK